MALAGSISVYTDIARRHASSGSQKKAELEQYFSSAQVAKLMASMMDYGGKKISILDPGAGIGSLFVACIDEIASQKKIPKEITVTAYEIDESLFEYLGDALNQCKMLCKEIGIAFSGRLIGKDFIKESISDGRQYTHVILNPPYRKINSFSEESRVLSDAGLKSPNMYSAFIALSERLLVDGGQMAFISPRSFCNGPYFQPFRKRFLKSMALKRIHVFDSRSSSFRDDDVLQENVIIHAEKSKDPAMVTVSSSSGPGDTGITVRHVRKRSVVHHDDIQSFIHIVPDEIGAQISDRMDVLHSNLDDLGIEVSTGKVIDFRIREALRQSQNRNTVPLIRPYNLSHGSIDFPVTAKQENHIEVTGRSRRLLVENGNYVVVKRFSAKEERRRIVASVFRGADFGSSLIGFENRVNYFHSNDGLEVDTAIGLSLFLNSTIVDSYFRQFNGHTQVNAADLRYIKYPTSRQLKTLGRKIKSKYPEQKEIDCIVEDVLFRMSKRADGIDPVPAQEKIDEAVSILKDLGFPKQQQNVRSGLALLALLGLRPSDRWDAATDPLIGITPMMKFFEKNYGKKYAPNSRETVRRQTVHQFVEAALVVENPDMPKRPTNSGKTAYRIDQTALKLLQSFGTSEWMILLEDYKRLRGTLTQRYSARRKISKIPLRLPSGETLELSPGGQNVLVEKICTEFAPRFAPRGVPLLIGDTARKSGYCNMDGLKALGVELKPHGKVPDVIIHDSEKGWLLAIEAVASHGPIDPKRRAELEKIFSGSKIGIVYVTAFLNQKSMLEYFGSISWETEVWTADKPDHMIHFNGSRFLGPYE